MQTPWCLPGAARTCVVASLGPPEPARSAQDALRDRERPQPFHNPPGASEIVNAHSERCSSASASTPRALRNWRDDKGRQSSDDPSVDLVILPRRIRELSESTPGATGALELLLLEPGLSHQRLGTSAQGVNRASLNCYSEPHGLHRALRGPGTPAPGATGASEPPLPELLGPQKCCLPGSWESPAILQDASSKPRGLGRRNSLSDGL